MKENNEVLDEKDNNDSDEEEQLETCELYKSSTMVSFTLSLRVNMVYIAETHTWTETAISPSETKLPTLHTFQSMAPSHMPHLVMTAPISLTFLTKHIRCSLRVGTRARS